MFSITFSFLSLRSVRCSLPYTNFNTANFTWLNFLLYFFLFLFPRSYIFKGLQRSKLALDHSVLLWAVVQPSEYTQSSHCRFLAYIQPWWKNQPWLVRVGCTPTPFSLLPSRTKLHCTVLLSGQIHPPCFISTNIMYSEVEPLESVFNTKFQKPAIVIIPTSCIWQI